MSKITFFIFLIYIMNYNYKYIIYMISILITLVNITYRNTTKMLKFMGLRSIILY